MSGETDLAAMLATIEVERRPGTYCFVVDAAAVANVAEATIVEMEGRTDVVAVESADAAGLSYDFEAAWLTLGVHSALEAVGLTAAVSTALATAGIPCNMLAGFHHDHLLVPVDRVDEAVEAIQSLRNAGATRR